MPINTLLLIGGIIIGGATLSAAKSKRLPVGSCIANELLCNTNDPNIDPWETQCYTGAILKIEKVGRRSYKTSCIEETYQCKKFVSFEDVKTFYFPIECPEIKKELRLYNSIPLPKE